MMPDEIFALLLPFKLVAAVSLSPLFACWAKRRELPDRFSKCVFYAMGVLISILGTEAFISLADPPEGVIPFSLLVFGFFGGPLAMQVLEGLKQMNWWALIVSRFGGKRSVNYRSDGGENAD